MCLPNFIEFKQIDKSSSLTGYRNWNNLIKNNNLELKSQNRNYIWNNPDGPHLVRDVDSGLYSYNYNSYNYYDNYNSYNYNSYNYNNHNYNSYNYDYYNSYNYYDYNYSIAGIIYQYGKVAIHKDGYRSEYAIIDTIFNIRRIDAEGPQKFLDWIDIFNERINQIANRYNCKVISWQGLIDSKREPNE